MEIEFNIFKLTEEEEKDLIKLMKKVSKRKRKKTQ